MMITLLAMLNDRRREMAILRAVGARPAHIVALLTFEAIFIGFGGAIIGLGLAYLGLAVAGPWIERTYGLALDIEAFGPTDLTLVVMVVACAAIAGLIPAFSAYIRSLADGIVVKS
jgi:putative ABC transport system permease protein